MSNNLAVISSRSALEKQIQMSFGEWVLHFGRKLTAILGGGVLLTVGSSSYKAITKLQDTTGPEFLLLFISGVQFSVIFLAVLFSSRVPQLLEIDGPELLGSTGTEGAPKAEQKVMSASGYTDAKDWRNAKSLSIAVLEQFKDKWLAIWICWLCLYFILAILYLPGTMHPSLRTVLDALATFANNLATLMILFCYFILSHPTIVRAPNGNYRSTIEWHRWIAVLFVFTVIEVVLLAFALQVIPNKLDIKPDFVTDTANWVSGIGAATVMGLFIGRLDSKFLECPTWFLVMLYLYAAIQPLFALLGQNHRWWTIILLNAALLFKCLLFIYINWLFQTGRLLFFLMRVRRLYDQVGSDFKDFSIILRKAS